MPVQPPFKPGSTYDTALPMLQEMQFRQWVAANKVPFNPRKEGPSDYDMRGYWQGLQNGNSQALPPSVNPNDNKPHYTDYYKTPSHSGFSGPGGPYTGGSQWAGPDAPQWVNGSQLANLGGRIILDERKPTLSLADLGSIFGK